MLELVVLVVEEIFKVERQFGVEQPEVAYLVEDGLVQMVHQCGESVVLAAFKVLKRAPAVWVVFGFTSDGVSSISHKSCWCSLRKRSKPRYGVILQFSSSVDPFKEKKISLIDRLNDGVS
ncbi:hypothetical protein OGAPHI_006142 [Ogataea philodendri]|uniref:Uncharacterized protein n=1 Tax=Ogataea philodendri TaxID=1378263 RepID=A0A9P8NXY7_9ASCO|nr:uncharacterized protein OGAPHI_006142 [Ogataea philodendri]KAH3661963.1 hypothetical protein OGAPHI_006142 [Ogataea philodendri]